MTNFITYIISPKHKSVEALHWCLHTAKQTDRKLKVLYVIESENKDLNEIEKGKKELEAVEKQIRMFAVPFQTELKFGPYLDVSIEAGGQEEVSLLVTVREKKSFLKGLFQKSEAGPLKHLIPCEMKIYPSSL